MPGRQPLFWLWLLFATFSSATMWMFPGQETIPYHLAWIALALAYDREVWSLRLTWLAVVSFTLATGSVLVVRAAEGVVGVQETAEIPLMSGLMLLVMWNVRRRQRALATLSSMASRDRARAALRERLTRLTSHEMRTPATIANGYAELLLARETDAGSRADLEVIRSELGRLVLASDRLVRMIRMPEQDFRRRVDLRKLLEETVERWHFMADRTWIVESDSMSFNCSADRVRACLDTLIENAVRYTDSGGTIRVFGRLAGDQALIGVADSGNGLDEHMTASVNHGPAEVPPSRAPEPDPKAQTGLGHALVQEAVAARGGRLVAGRSAEGGALLVMVVPLDDVPPRSAEPAGRRTTEGASPGAMTSTAQLA